MRVCVGGGVGGGRGEGGACNAGLWLQGRGAHSALGTCVGSLHPMQQHSVPAAWPSGVGRKPSPARPGLHPPHPPTRTSPGAQTDDPVLLSSDATKKAETVARVCNPILSKPPPPPPKKEEAQQPAAGAQPEVGPGLGSQTGG